MLMEAIIAPAAGSWSTEERPLLHSMLSHSLLISDLSDLALQYVDGSGRAFAPQPAEGEATAASGAPA